MERKIGTTIPRDMEKNKRSIDNIQDKEDRVR